MLIALQWLPASDEPGKHPATRASGDRTASAVTAPLACGGPSPLSPPAPLVRLRPFHTAHCMGRPRRIPNLTAAAVAAEPLAAEPSARPRGSFAVDAGVAQVGSPQVGPETRCHPGSGTLWLGV